MRKFKFAGVSKVDGRLRLRASNRDNYDQILVRDKNTSINIIQLDKPMTKPQICQALLRRKDFKSPAIQKLLHDKMGEEAPAPRVVKKRAVKKASAPSVAQAAA